ncbi:hypothetical protein [Sphingobium yanoikuyae]|uniref:hypothetical protein n=1 Tax=Sphingobium yanoikuyae TaxID=13690 RepID=UPI0004E2B6D9|nr:hypothetical protein [Sphingobium yanoikuyae]KFD26155.1 hypothetical protein IH86_21600 [Sphingobium yanoikuyae]MDV3480840.1 hypothetical protein [Sphingobium yanoikuyae]
MNYHWLGTRLPEYEMGQPAAMQHGDLRPTISNVTEWVGRDLKIGVNTWNIASLYLERPSGDGNNASTARFGGEAETLLQEARAKGESILAGVFACDFCGDASLGVITDFDGAAQSHFFRRGDQGNWVGGDVPDMMNRQIKEIREAIGRAMLDAYKLPSSVWDMGK